MSVGEPPLPKKPLRYGHFLSQVAMAVGIRQILITASSHLRQLYVGLYNILSSASLNPLTHFSLIFPCYAPRKRQKIFLNFPGA